MELSELTALWAGLKLYANTVNEVARRAGTSPTYVNRTMQGKVKSWRENPTCLQIIEEVKSMLEEKHAASQSYISQTSLAC